MSSSSSVSSSSERFPGLLRPLCHDVFSPPPVPVPVLSGPDRSLCADGECLSPDDDNPAELLVLEAGECNMAVLGSSPEVDDDDNGVFAAAAAAATAAAAAAGVGSGREKAGYPG